MTELKRYQCDICKELYADPQVAIRCEGSHILPKKITSYKYDTDTNKRYPQYIFVNFSDGSIVSYKKSL